MSHPDLTPTQCRVLRACADILSSVTRELEDKRMRGLVVLDDLQALVTKLYALAGRTDVESPRNSRMK